MKFIVPINVHFKSTDYVVCKHLIPADLENDKNGCTHCMYVLMTKMSVSVSVR